MSKFDKNAVRDPIGTNFATIRARVAPPVNVPKMVTSGPGGYTPTHRNGGPTWNSGLRAGTPIQPTNNKGDGKDIGRGKVVTY